MVFSRIANLAFKSPVSFSCSFLILTLPVLPLSPHTALAHVGRTPGQSAQPESSKTLQLLLPHVQTSTTGRQLGRPPPRPRLLHILLLPRSPGSIGPLHFPSYRPSNPLSTMATNSQTRSPDAPDAGQFQCGTCMRKYKRLDHLARHVRSRKTSQYGQSQGRMAQSPRRSYRLCCRRQLTTPSVPDTQTKPFQCPICNKAFART